MPIKSRYSLRYVQNRYIWLPLLTPPPEGWTISIKFSMDVSGWPRYQHNNNNNRFMVLCLGLPGWACTRRNTRPPIIQIIIQSVSASSIYHDPQHSPCSNYVLGNLFAPLSMSTLVYLLGWSPPPHIPNISSPNQCLLFAAHAHTTATCFAVVSVLYHHYQHHIKSNGIEILRKFEPPE